MCREAVLAALLFLCLSGLFACGRSALREHRATPVHTPAMQGRPAFSGLTDGGGLLVARGPQTLVGARQGALRFRVLLARLPAGELAARHPGGGREGRVPMEAVPLCARCRPGARQTASAGFRKAIAGLPET